MLASAVVEGSDAGNDQDCIAVVIYLQCMVSQWASWKAGGAHLGSCPIPIAFIIIVEAMHHFHGLAALKFMFIVFLGPPSCLSLSLL